MDLIKISWVLEVVITALPANEVPEDLEGEDTERGGGSPVNEGVTKEEIFDGLVVPGAHTETDIENGPLPELGSEVVLLVWVWDKGVVGSHHGDVEM